MVYPDHIEQKLGFNTLRSIIKDKCVSTLGHGFVDKVSLSKDFSKIKKLLQQTQEFKLIIQSGTAFPSQNYLDLRPDLHKLKTEGHYLSEEAFYGLKLALTTIQDILDFYTHQEQLNLPNLTQLTSQAKPLDLKDWSPLLSQLNRIFDDTGEIKDNATPELAEIRRKLSFEHRQVRNNLERIYKTALKSGWIGEEMSLTVRNGRLVIPLLAEHKRKLKGFVHDESATGQMAFVEPAEVIETNNLIRELEIKERREIIKILTELSASFRPYADQLIKAFIFLGLTDFIRAKALFAVQINATLPILVKDTIIEWKEAIHPLLYIAHKKLNKEVVPLEVSLNKNQRILVVSGPNAGGKSVMLKTIGLLQYMIQCGLLVPANEDSKFGIFNKILLDIGDEQSIENDLSTYSSHLRNMRVFLENANQKTLLLIDEFGTGTEPALGGAIAEAILEKLEHQEAIGVINTHYSNLKTFANKNEHLINGAMKFDAEKLEPIYELEMGKPGSSFALEVAFKMGINPQIIKRAKQKLNSHQINFEKLNKELEIEKKVFQEKNVELREKNHKLNQKLEQYTGLKEFLETEKKSILNKAKQEAKDLVDSTNQKIEKTIREIKETKAEKEATIKVRQDLKEFANKKLKVAKKVEPIKEIEGVISPGSFVRIKGQETIGEVLELKNKEAIIAIGQLKSTIKLNRLQKISKKEFKKELPKANYRGIDISERAENFSFNLDIRGKRGDEALQLLDQTLDDAIILGSPEVRVLHGKGDGILRKLVRNHLKTYKQIKAVKDEHADRGGYGVTIVEMK